MINFYHTVYDIQRKPHPIYYCYYVPLGTIKLHSLISKRTKPHLMVYDFDFTDKSTIHVHKTNDCIEINYID